MERLDRNQAGAFGHPQDVAHRDAGALFELHGQFRRQRRAAGVGDAHARDVGVHGGVRQRRQDGGDAGQRRHAVALAELPVIAHERRVAHAGQGGQHLGRPDRQQRQAVDKGAGDMEQREAVDLDRVRVEAIVIRREPGGVRLVALGVQCQLGGAGGAAGVIAGGHAVRRERRLETELGGLVLQRQGEIHSVVRRRSGNADGDDGQGLEGQHLGQGGPEVEFAVGAERDDHLRARSFEEARDVLGVQQVIERTGAPGQLRAPQGVMRFGNVGGQDRHGVVRAHAQAAEQVGGAVDLRQQLRIADAPGCLVRLARAQIDEGVAVGKLPRRPGDQAVRAARRNLLVVRPRLQCADVGQGSKRRHGRIVTPPRRPQNPVRHRENAITRHPPGRG